MSDKRTAIAYHEAGHAVTALARGLVVSTVNIVPDKEEGSTGQCRVPLPEGFDQYDDDARRVLRDHLVCTMAGRVAQERATGTTEGDEADTSSWFTTALYGETDADHREEFCEELGRVAPVMDYSRAWRHYGAYCRRLLDAYWPAVEAVADALLRDQTLDAATVRRVAERAQGTEFPSPAPNPQCRQCGARLVNGSGKDFGLPDLCNECTFKRRTGQGTG